MKALCTTLPNPFDPRQAVQVDVRRRMRIRHLAPRSGVTVAFLNGRPVLRSEWRRRLSDGDQLVFAALPAGGGGGAGGGSNPIRTLLSVALLAFTGGAGFTAFMGNLGLTGVAAKLGGVAVSMLGMSAINALMPVRTPASLPAPSPTYSLDAQGNAARLGTVIPVQYGRLLAWPDLAAQPYTEYFGDDQFVFQLLCLGAGEYDIEEIRIEDTPIAAFSEIQYEVIPPGGEVTLFPTAVTSSTEVSGQELLGAKAATWTASGSAVTITEVGHGRASGQTIRIEATSGTAPAGFYTIGTVPGADSYTITASGFGASGAAMVFTPLGGASGFVASGAGTSARQLGVDFVLPYGLYHDTGTGTLADLSLAVACEIQPVGDTGLPTGAWVALPVQTITDRSNTPVRKSVRFDVTPGRYRFRAWRTDVKSTSDSDGHQVLLAGLRSYLTEATDFPGVTLIAMRMRATNNLSLQASRRVAVVATRKLPTWNGETWSAPVATRSIAWAIADAARSTVYSAGLSDREIDLPALLALDALWAARGDYFDYRFDQAGTWWGAIQTIAKAGRAQCIMQGGVLRPVRDGAASVPVAMFSERNIKAGSFSVSYIHQTADTADTIIAKYWDATTWSEQTVSGKVPGATSTKPSPVRLDGVTTRAQAKRDATYLAFVNRRRRRICRFEVEMEGRLPVFGDLIAIQHSMPGWGQQAEARGWDAATRTLTLSEPLTWTAGQVHSLILRRPDGSSFGPVVVTRGSDAYEVVLPGLPDFEPETGNDRIRTHVAFGPNSTWSAQAKVARVTPRGLYEYEIEAVVEDPAVHTADQGLITPPVVYSQLPRRVIQPVVRSLVGRRMAGSTTKALFSWTPAPNAVSYQIDMAEGDDPHSANVTWTRVADTTSSNIVTELLYGARTMIRMRGIGLAAGPWIFTTLGDLIPDFWLSDDTPFWLDDSEPFWSN